VSVRVSGQHDDLFSCSPRPGSFRFQPCYGDQRSKGLIADEHLSTARKLTPVSETFVLLIEQMFVGPLWPASVLVCLLVIYALVALLGLVHLDFGLHGDANLDPNQVMPSAETSVESDWFGGAGAATLRWLNLERLPLVLWLSVFTIAFWTISYLLWYGFDQYRYLPTWLPSLLLVLRNGVIAILATKVLTGPLNHAFQAAPSYGPSKLIGETCVVSSGEVTGTFGQAKYKTDAAPLLLNICTDGETLLKGAEVRILAFDQERRIYKVAAVSEENPQ